VDQEFISTLRATLSAYLDLRLAIVFGSLAADSPRYDSDLDIAVGGDRPLSSEKKIELIERLARAFGRPVDLIDLSNVGEPLLGEILLRGRRVIGSDEDHGALLFRHLVDSADFLPCRDRILAARRREWLQG